MSAPLTAISPDDVRLRDPLTDVTRRERRSLLGISMLGIAVAQGGLLPTEISSLGIKFGPGSQSVLLLILGLVCGYYLIAFLVYALSDYIAWKMALRAVFQRIWTGPRDPTAESESEEEALLQIRRQESLEEFIQKNNSSILIAEFMLLPASRVRAIFEFVLPAVVGAYSTTVLLLRSAA